jgi:hypothetical protein
VREPWQRINLAVRRALAAVTLADLAPQAPTDPATIPLQRLAARAPSGLEPIRRES